jgi:hypothetical protein
MMTDFVIRTTLLNSKKSKNMSVVQKRSYNL